MGWIQRYWAVIAVLLTVATLCGGIVLFFRQSGAGQPLEILPQEATPFPQTEVYVGGEVANPGLYQLQGNDSLEDIIGAAGGFTEGADLNRLEFYVPSIGESSRPQKIDLNRAEVWLLDTLPGIGPALAQAIVDYRLKHGPFRNITELTRVEGIGPAIFDKIKDLITVKD